MAWLTTTHQRAAFIILLLAALLAVALWPYATGLVGVPVLYVTFQPLHEWLARRVKPRAAAGIVTAFALFLIVVPGVSFAGLIATEAQQIASGVVQSPILTRLAELHIGQYRVGPQLAGLGEKIIAWLGSSAFSLVGTATRLTLNLAISLFGLYYLLLRPQEIWTAVRPYIPFSTANTEKLRTRFRDVTTSTLIGTGVTAAIQGALVGVGFWVTGLPNAVFWSVVTLVFAILPVVGSGLVWAPGALALFLDGRHSAGIGLLVWGIIIVGNVDYIIRPMVFRRWAQIHPFVTLVGALAGVSYMGILGLLIGPLALSYFFELIRMYREEYIEAQA